MTCQHAQFAVDAELLARQDHKVAVRQHLRHHAREAQASPLRSAGSARFRHCCCCLSPDQLGGIHRDLLHQIFQPEQVRNAGVLGPARIALVLFFTFAASFMLTTTVTMSPTWPRVDP